MVKPIYTYSIAPVIASSASAIQTGDVTIINVAIDVILLLRQSVAVLLLCLQYTLVVHGVNKNYTNYTK